MQNQSQSGGGKTYSNQPSLAKKSGILNSVEKDNYGNTKILLEYFYNTKKDNEIEEKSGFIQFIYKGKKPFNELGIQTGDEITISYDIVGFKAKKSETYITVANAFHIELQKN